MGKMPGRPTGGGGVNDGGHHRGDAARSNRSWDDVRSDVRSDEMIKECGREGVATKRARFNLKGDDVGRNSEFDTKIIREVSSSWRTRWQGGHGWARQHLFAPLSVLFGGRRGGQGLRTSTHVCIVISSIWRTSRWPMWSKRTFGRKSGSSRATKIPGTFVVDSESNGNVAQYTVDVSLPCRRRFVCW